MIHIHPPCLTNIDIVAAQNLSVAGILIGKRNRFIDVLQTEIAQMTYLTTGQLIIALLTEADTNDCRDGGALQV